MTTFYLIVDGTVWFGPYTCPATNTLSQFINQISEQADKEGLSGPITVSFNEPTTSG